MIGTGWPSAATASKMVVLVQVDRGLGFQAFRPGAVVDTEGHVIDAHGRCWRMCSRSPPNPSVWPANHRLLRRQPLLIDRPVRVVRTYPRHSTAHDRRPRPERPGHPMCNGKYAVGEVRVKATRNCSPSRRTSLPVHSNLKAMRLSVPHGVPQQFQPARRLSVRR